MTWNKKIIKNKHQFRIKDKNNFFYDQLTWIQPIEAVYLIDTNYSVKLMGGSDLILRPTLRRHWSPALAADDQSHAFCARIGRNGIEVGQVIVVTFFWTTHRAQEVLGLSMGKGQSTRVNKWLHNRLRSFASGHTGS